MLVMIEINGVGITTIIAVVVNNSNHHLSFLGVGTLGNRAWDLGLRVQPKASLRHESLSRRRFTGSLGWVMRPIQGRYRDHISIS